MSLNLFVKMLCVFEIAAWLGTPSSSLADGPWIQLCLDVEYRLHLPSHRGLSRLLAQLQPREEIHLNGIELEGVVPESLEPKLRLALVDSISHRFGIPKSSIRTRGVSVSFDRDGDLYEFELKKDASIYKEKGLQDVEVTSPKLRSEEDSAAFRAVAGDLAAFGVRAEPTSTGIHVHVGLESNTAPFYILPAERRARIHELSAIWRVYSILEPELRRFYGIAPYRQTYLRPVDPGLLQKIDSGTVTLRDFENTQGIGSHKPALRYTKHGTIEGRIAPSSFDPNIIAATQRFWHRLVWGVLSRDVGLTHYLLTTPPERVELLRVMRILDVDPLALRP